MPLQRMIVSVIYAEFTLSSLLLGGQPQGASSQQASSQEFWLVVDKDLITARIRNHPLSLVLDQFVARSRVRITLAQSMDSENVTFEIEKMPIEDALRHILRKYDAFYYYTAESGTDSKLQAVWVYPKGGASGMTPVAPEVWARIDDLLTSASDADASVRERAYEAIISRPGSRSTQVVIAAIRGFSEKDGNVRERLLSKAVASGVPIPSTVLADLARADSSEQIRWMALDALGNDPVAARSVAEAALADASEAVRAKAQEILAEDRPRSREAVP